MNLAVAQSLPLVDNLPPAFGTNGHLAGSRSAAGMVSRSLTDRIDLAWNPTTGNILATGKLLSLAGQNRGIDLLWRYNSINDHRPTLSEGTAETALTVGADTQPPTGHRTAGRTSSCPRPAAAGPCRRA